MNPEKAFQDIESELMKFSENLSKKTRWLILNKIDLLPSSDVDNHCNKIIENIGWKGPIYKISAISGEGCNELGNALMEKIEKNEID